MKPHPPPPFQFIKPPSKQPLPPVSEFFMPPLPIKKHKIINILDSPEAMDKFPVIYNFKEGDLVATVAPACSKLPRNEIGKILKQYSNGMYKIVLNCSDTIIYENVPHYFLRPQHILMHGQKVQEITLRQLLSKNNYRMPTYQRRYAWKQAQWQGLFQDSQKGPHSLGRLTVYQHQGNTIVCDGQQRLTTSAILLAVCRDLAMKLDIPNYVKMINFLLIANPASFIDWKSQKKCIKQGQVLQFMRIVPTLADRIPFYKAIILSECPANSVSSIMLAKAYFKAKLEQFCHSKDELINFIDNALDGLYFLNFEISDTSSNQVIYEGLAKREQGLQMICNDRPGQQMSFVDFIRNFLLEHFQSEEEKVGAHSKYWLPIQLAQESLAKFEEKLMLFLQKQGFQIYERNEVSSYFESWVERRKKQRMEDSSGGGQIAIDIMKELYDQLS